MSHYVDYGVEQSKGRGAVHPTLSLAHRDACSARLFALRNGAKEYSDQCKQVTGSCLLSPAVVEAAFLLVGSSSS